MSLVRPLRPLLWHPAPPGPASVVDEHLSARSAAMIRPAPFARERGAATLPTAPRAPVQGRLTIGERPLGQHPCHIHGMRGGFLQELAERSLARGDVRERILLERRLERIGQLREDLAQRVDQRAAALGRARQLLVAGDVSSGDQRLENRRARRLGAQARGLAQPRLHLRIADELVNPDHGSLERAVRVVARRLGVLCHHFRARARERLADFQIG